MLDLLAFPDGILECVASHFDPNQLLILALTCKRLQTLVEGVAQTFINDATEEERNNLPQVELPIVGIQEWVGRRWGVIVNYKLILAQRATLHFDQLIGDVDHPE